MVVFHHKCSGLAFDDGACVVFSLQNQHLEIPRTCQYLLVVRQAEHQRRSAHGCDFLGVSSSSLPIFTAGLGEYRLVVVCCADLEHTSTYCACLGVNCYDERVGTTAPFNHSVVLGCSWLAGPSASFCDFVECHIEDDSFCSVGSYKFVVVFCRPQLGRLASNCGYVSCCSAEDWRLRHSAPWEHRMGFGSFAFTQPASV
mmetsp:Transcript_172456/g.552822  ORF Transcript_172456/g.552822 Transcript_172456/m.552822 type:complete len:200 (+) Transcript_172456:683-1282(+)